MSDEFDAVILPVIGKTSKLRVKWTLENSNDVNGIHDWADAQARALLNKFFNWDDNHGQEQ